MSRSWRSWDEKPTNQPPTHVMLVGIAEELHLWTRGGIPWISRERGGGAHWPITSCHAMPCHHWPPLSYTRLHKLFIHSGNKAKGSSWQRGEPNDRVGPCFVVGEWADKEDDGFMCCVVATHRQWAKFQKAHKTRTQFRPSNLKPTEQTNTLAS